MMSTFQFGLGTGHLPKKAERVARKHGAELVNYTEPGTGCERHWFNAPNLGQPHDGQRAKAVLDELRTEGVIEGGDPKLLFVGVGDPGGR